MGSATLQGAFLLRHRSSFHVLREKCMFVPFSKGNLFHACRNARFPGRERMTQKRAGASNAHSRNVPFSVSCSAEGDMELVEVQLPEPTPLEAFFNRHSSFLETLDFGKLRRLIKMCSLNPENASPNILVMLGNRSFVNQLYNEYPDCNVEVCHFSVSVLADIKEEYDDARCFYINTTDFSEIAGSFDAIFLNYFSVFSKSLPRLLKDITRFCNPGAMVVLSLAQDKKLLTSLKVQSGGIVKSFLPDEDSLLNMVSVLPLEVVSFEDAPNFYLAALKFTGAYDKVEKRKKMANITKKEDIEYPLYVKGEVVHGFGRGSKKLGFPTANISIDDLPPKAFGLPKGVYYGCAQLVGEGLDSNVHRMVMNIGNRPTFDKDDTLSLEVHILHDFETDFYGKELRIAILGFIREEMQFASAGDLIRRIEEDIRVMQGVLSDAEIEIQRRAEFFSQS
ncbi:hypothetical protein KP509_08G047700 [Ceratopteris richardii]|uniref:riboflavin kinase n=1 Tax=Ceratopteris richardii TaxID=49495 RepID=A0A8T2UD01_CERRI|nr:hypothetical protein KP509_08G047700 [Ceratopteris richardii]